MAKITVLARLESVIQPLDAREDVGGQAVTVKFEPYEEAREFAVAGYEPKEAAEVLQDVQAGGAAIILALSKKDDGLYPLFLDKAHVALDTDTNARLRRLQAIFKLKFMRREGRAKQGVVVTGAYPVKLEQSADLIAVVNSQPVANWLMLMTAAEKRGKTVYHLFRTDVKQGAGVDGTAGPTSISRDDCFNRPTQEERLRCLRDKGN
jgi:hypothetical protein